MKKTKKDNMIPGKKYRGYGYLNEYNEFCFEPENTGARAGVVKTVAQRDGVCLSHTRDNILLHIKVKKTNDPVSLLRAIMGKFNVAAKLVQEYEI